MKNFLVIIGMATVFISLYIVVSSKNFEVLLITIIGAILSFTKSIAAYLGGTEVLESISGEAGKGILDIIVKEDLKIAAELNKLENESKLLNPLKEPVSLNLPSNNECVEVNNKN